MKKHKICKILLVILAVLLFMACYELLGICIAYKKQPEMSEKTIKEIQEEQDCQRAQQAGSDHRKEFGSSFTKSAID